MSAPRPFTPLSAADLIAASEITTEDRALAQRTAPKVLQPYLNADGPTQ